MFVNKKSVCGRDFLAAYMKAVVIAQNGLMESLARTQSKLLNTDVKWVWTQKTH